MSRSDVAKSLRLWTRRASYRRRKWRHYVSAERRARTEEAKHAAHQKRAHWFEEYKHAKYMIARRTRQLLAFRPTTMSRSGMEFLVREEGVRQYAYNDSQNNATFGVGHLIHHGPVNEADRRRYGTPENPKSMEFVFETLESDLKNFEKAVRESTNKKLKKHHQFDACVSLAFNIGVGGFIGSTVSRRIREGRFNAAADAFLMWDNPPELRPRRERERKLFLRGY
jgi:lysozyme